MLRELACRRKAMPNNLRACPSAQILPAGARGRSSSGQTLAQPPPQKNRRPNPQVYLRLPVRLRTTLAHRRSGPFTNRASTADVSNAFIRE